MNEASNGARPLAVLHVIDGLGMGGAETWLIEVLRRWSRESIGRMDFLATGGTPAIFDDEARALGAKVFYVRYGRANLGAFAGDFRRILKAGCYACHGHEAEGAVGPDLTDDEWIFRPTDAMIFNTIANGRRGTVMAPFADQLTPDEIWRIVEFLRQRNRERQGR